MARRATWIGFALVYACFFVWYTNLSGPMTDTEIDAVLDRARTAGRPPAALRTLETFMRSDTGDDFVMVNLLELNRSPPELPATGPNAPPMALIDHYMEHMYAEQLKRASHPIFFGTVIGNAMDLSGISGAESWTQSGLFRYRSRRDVLAIATDPAFDERHEYKMAALMKTIAVPVEPTVFVDMRLFVALLLFSIAALLDIVVLRRRS